MSVVIGLDAGHASVRVAALVDDRAHAIPSFPAWLAWRGDEVLVGAAARACDSGERLGRLPAWLERTSDEGEQGGAPGPLTSVWPLAGGARRPPALALAYLLRAASLAAEERHGPVLGAVLAVDPSLGAVARRALRDAGAIAGIPATRQLAAAACASLLVPAADGVWLVADAGAGALALTIVERFGDAIHVLAHLRDRELGGDALDATVAAALDVDGEPIDPDDDAWPALCELARAIKEAAPAEEQAALGARLDGRVRLPTAAEVGGWLDARLRRVDELCQRALATSRLTGGALGGALLVGGGAGLTGLADRLARTLGRPPIVPDQPADTIALGAATAARMFLSEPAALFLDVSAHGLALSDGHALEPLIAAGALVPARARHLIATERAEQDSLAVELWEQGLRTRPYARYEIGGLPAAPAGDAIASCELLVDADQVPVLAARELVSGAPLTVEPVEEAALAASELAAARELVTSWRP